jgi:hypothetical protein
VALTCGRKANPSSANLGHWGTNEARSCGLNMGSRQERLSDSCLFRSGAPRDLMDLAPVCAQHVTADWACADRAGNSRHDPLRLS